MQLTDRQKTMIVTNANPINMNEECKFQYNEYASNNSQITPKEW